MTNRRLLLIPVSFLTAWIMAGSSLPSYAGDPALTRALDPSSGALDPSSATALQQTQQLLRDPAKRNAAIQADPNAKAVDQNVRAFTGNAENTDELYGISADVMKELTGGANGDPAKMSELLQKAQADPAAFENSLSPEVREKIRRLAEQIAPEVKPSGVKK